MKPKHKPRVYATKRLERRRAFELPCLPLDYELETTMEIRRQADLLFEKIKQCPAYKKSIQERKREFVQHLVNAGRRALYHGWSIAYSRSYGINDCTKVSLQMIEASVQAGLFEDYRSLPRSKKMSRLVPTEELVEGLLIDPWTLGEEDGTSKQLVFLRRRGSKDHEELPFDKEEGLPKETQKRLEEVNKVNSLYRIVYEKYDEWERECLVARRLRPVHYAIFTDDFYHHGRIYTGKYGHQSLRKIERKTIDFNNTHSVEMDYSALHPRMLYHLEGIDYVKDPYALWGGNTTPPMRLMAKICMNAAINAESGKAAVSACNQAMSFYGKGTDKEGKRLRKTGKELDDARTLYTAYEKTGLKFKDIYDKIRSTHKKLEKHFGSDAGLKLMRLDSMIALDVLYYFAEKCIPVLGCHDSFLVPEFARDELFQVMHEVYKSRLHYYPLIK